MSDSSDEDLSKLRESVDPQFINDGMYTKSCKNGPKKEPVSAPSILPSLRQSKDDSEQFICCGTSSQQNFLAKHLSQHLDNVIKYKRKSSETEEKKVKGGVKLFRHCSNNIELDETPEINRSKPKRPKIEEDPEDMEKIKSVAVSPSDILSKKDTRHWSTRSKAQVFTYIKTDNGLILK